MAATPYVYRATVTAVHDGDTCHLAADLGFRITFDVDCRLWGLNARELAQPGGKEARDHLAALCPAGTVVLFHSVGADKYGRWLGVITRPDGRDVATQMIRDGYAAPWTGKGAAPVAPWPIPAA